MRDVARKDSLRVNHRADGVGRHRECPRRSGAVAVWRAGGDRPPLDPEVRTAERSRFVDDDAGEPGVRSPADDALAVGARRRERDRAGAAVGPGQVECPRRDLESGDTGRDRGTFLSPRCCTSSRGAVPSRQGTSAIPSASIARRRHCGQLAAQPADMDAGQEPSGREAVRPGTKPGAYAADPSSSAYSELGEACCLAS